MQALSHPSNKTTRELSELDQVNHPPITLVFGGGISSDVSSAVKNNWIHHRLKTAVIDAGKEALPSKTLIEKIASHLVRGSHLMLFIHGVAPQEANNHKHHLRINFSPESGESTLGFLELVIAQAKKLNPAQTKAHLPLPVVHILSCYSGALSSELRPDSRLWKSAHFVVYAGKKFTCPNHYGAAMNAAASYISDCAQRGKAVNPLRLFFLAGCRSGDGLRMLGGKLQAPLILHAPKLAIDLQEERLAHRLEAGLSDKADFYLSAIETFRLDGDLTETSPAIAELLQTRIGRRDLQSVAQLLKDCPRLVNQPSSEGVLSLNVAILEGFEPMIELLLKSGASLWRTDAVGVGPTLTTLLTGNDPLLEKLLTKGANPNETDIYGNSALFFAVIQRSDVAAALLLEYGADVNYSCQDETALTLAVDKGNAMMVELLLKHGAGRDAGLSHELAATAVQNKHIGIAELLYRALLSSPRT